MIEREALIVPNEILFFEVKRLLQQGHTATFRVKGWSMRIFLENERDIVKLASIKPEDIRRKDIVLAEIAPQKYVLHRVIRRQGNILTLKGDGNLRGTETCLDTDVVGIVTAFYRKGRSKPDLVNGWKWRTYSTLWLMLTPLRRIILGIYRRIPHKKYPDYLELQ